MKLISCYISSFGKLKDFTYNFNQGLNVIMQENGWGKSTFATFIKAMFYGLNDSKRNVEDNERKKYMPWNSTARFGGKIRFSIGEKQFEIERFFGKKASDDSMKLTDLSTGISHEENSDWGKRIFKVDEDGFLSTTFFSQKDLQIKDSHSIAEKYNKACEVEQSEQYEKAIAKLENKIKSYSYSGGRGLIPQTENEIFNLKNQLELQNKAKDYSQNVKASISDKEKEISNLYEKHNNLTTLWEESCKLDTINLKIQQYSEIEEQIKEEDKIIADSSKVLNGNNVSAETISQYTQCVSDLELANHKSQMLKNDILSLQQQCDNLSKNTISSKKPLLNDKANILLILLSIAMVVGAVLISAFLSLIVGISLCVLGILSIIIFVVLYLLNKKDVNKTPNNALIPIQNMLQDKNSNLNEIDDIIQKYIALINEFFNKFNLSKDLNYNQKLSLIEKLTIQFSKATEEREKLLNKLSRIEEELNKMGVNASKILMGERLVVEKNNNGSQIKEQLEQVKRLINQLENQVISEKIKLNAYELDGEKASETFIKINELNEKLCEYKEQLKIYSLTLDFLKKADENLKIKYKEPLVNALNKYLNYINNAKILGNIDINLKMTVDEGGFATDTDFYSKGLKDLFEICKRFALIEILFTEEKPFIVLDDPFCNFDEEKIENTLNLLRELSKDFQMIYFVCHKSRSV